MLVAHAATTEHQRHRRRLYSLRPRPADLCPAEVERSHLDTTMNTFASDLFHAARTLLRARAFTAVCVVSLGLGMGVVIAILLLLRMMFGTPPGVQRLGLAELVIRPTGQLLAQTGNRVIATWSYPDYLDVRDGTPAGLVVTGWSEGDGLFRLPAAAGRRDSATQRCSCRATTSRTSGSL